MSKKNKVEKANFRIIGDVHAKFDKYAHLAAGVKYSLQVGDMGFNYSYINRIVDPNFHRAIGGNHDNYNRLECPECKGENSKFCTLCKGNGYIFHQQSPHFLGDFGTWEVPDFGSLFFMRGAWSIDYQHRIPGYSWWPDEELSHQRGLEAVEAYKKAKPEFMVTHTAPKFIIPEIPFERIFGDVIHSTMTETTLQQMYDIHQPRYWLFGHWHKNFKKVVEHPTTNKKTRFVCLDELSYMDFPENFLNSDIEPSINH